MEIFILKPLFVGKLSVFYGKKYDDLMHREGLNGYSNYVNNSVYKFQTKVLLQVDKVKLMKVIKVAAINNLGLNLLLTYPTYWLQKVVDCPFHPDQLPDWWSFIKQMVVFITYQEIIFYYSHR